MLSLIMPSSQAVVVAILSRICILLFETLGLAIIVGLGKLLGAK